MGHALRNPNENPLRKLVYEGDFRLEVEAELSEQRACRVVRANVCRIGVFVAKDLPTEREFQGASQGVVQAEFQVLFRVPLKTGGSRVEGFNEYRLPA